jgi:hypothetical protein
MAMRIAGFLFAGALAAQAPQEVRIRSAPYAPPGALISVQSNLVEVTATVRDARGRLVAGLTRDDFELLDNGRPREIAVFAEQRAGRVVAPSARGAAAAPTADAPAPRSIALFFDDLHIAAFGLSKAKRNGGAHGRHRGRGGARTWW